MAWCSAKQKPKYKNLVGKSRAREFPHKELIFRLLTALLRTLIFRGSIIMANKEDHMNMKNMSAKNMENNESNMSHMDHDMTETDHSQMNMNHGDMDMAGTDMMMHGGSMMHMGNLKVKFWVSVVLAIPVLLLAPIM
ncbi:MAG: copper-translocating P-type ATPase, partial [Limosilactobacillus sp.]|nr:copper-translocating P-type ATPase [Limosilactobacillus sp.]